MTEQELREKTPQELAVMAAEAMGWTRIPASKGCPTSFEMDGKHIMWEGAWNPVSDASQAIELAEIVRRQVVGCFYLTESPYDGADGGSNHYAAFYWVRYEETVKASDPSFPLALTLASFLTWDALKVAR